MDGKKIDTPPKELELLYHLASTPNRVYTRNQLLDEVWGFDYFGDSRTVDVHIKRLREKVEGVSDQWALKTVWGVGYKFENHRRPDGERGSHEVRCVSTSAVCTGGRCPSPWAWSPLTLLLLGASFFSLSYSYARGQKTDELLVQGAGGRPRFPCGYLETGRYLAMEELQADQEYQQLTATAAIVSEMDILVCDQPMDTCCSPRMKAWPGKVGHHPPGRDAARYWITAPGPAAAGWIKSIHEQAVYRRAWQWSIPRTGRVFGGGVRRLRLHLHWIIMWRAFAGLVRS